VIAETLEGRMHQGRLLEESFGHVAKTCSTARRRADHRVRHQLPRRYWSRATGSRRRAYSLPGRGRQRVSLSQDRRVPPDTLFVTISQSGETADTLAALRAAKQAGYLGSLVVCNVPESSLVRESDVALMTRAGPEIGVASTKAFTTQLVALRC
jgi:glucosamine--fructose-6-phosphate aminotransferase (isomerizing)